MDKINGYAAECTCGRHHAISMDAIVVEQGAIGRIAPYLASRGYRHAGIVADANTHKAAGAAIESRLNEAGIGFTTGIILPNAAGDVVADEASVVQAMLEISNKGADVLLAVGSGTLHDITRFTAYTTNKPFLSIPTAPSVDGFNSVGAPLIIRGFKQTISAVSPDALFADLDILAGAPRELAAAGFGDMLGKYTSLADWSFSHLVHNEPYCEAAARITRQALESAVGHAGLIAEGTPEGIRILIDALIDSGLAMSLFGQSHPASGAEHHLSHYWEMHLLHEGRRQILHGAKVGVACALISEFYKTRFLDDLPASGSSLPLVRIRERLAEIRELIDGIPDPEDLKELLRAAGGPATPEELGIEPVLVRTSLEEAHRLRNRFTMLKAHNEWN